MSPISFRRTTATWWSTCTSSPARGGPRWWVATAPRSKLRVAAPPAEGRANDATCALLARTLGVKDAAVSLVSGASSRTKRVRIDGIDGPETANALELAISAAQTDGGNLRRGPRGSP